MTRWAVRIARSEVAQAAPLWNADGVEVCVDGDAVWLRGPRLNGALDGLLRRLGGADRFVVEGAGGLVPAGGVVPTTVMPAGPWQVLCRAVGVVFPLASFPTAAARLRTSPEARVTIGLERTATYREPAALLACGSDFLGYVDGASQVRLRRWTFAVDETGRVIVRGTPLPPIPGEQFVDFDGILVPAGWQWTPAVDALTLRRALGIEDGDAALFSPDGSWRRIASEDLVAATRSAVRLSLSPMLMTD